MVSNYLKILRFNPNDNVAVAMDALVAGDHVEDGSFTAKEVIPAGHKIAVCNIKIETAVYKYGQIIGFASQDISTGQHVHDHNVTMGHFTRDYAIAKDARPPEKVTEKEQASFGGIVRPDGRVATRNFIGVLSTVSCSSSVARFIAGEMRAEIANDYPNIDGIVALGHGAGCCHTPDSEGLAFLQRVLAGYAQHPNFGGVVMVGLGCEVNNLGSCRPAGLIPATVKPVDIQKPAEQTSQ